MSENKLFIESTVSTNDFLRELSRQKQLPEGFLVHTDFQTAGKGQPSNSWESEKGKNLLFSILLYPQNIQINKQFIISQLTSLAIKHVLDQYAEGFSIKWSNDIYWNDKKIAGILIENSLLRDKIDKCIIGIGLNINQEIFQSNAPNPISLKQIIGKETDRKQILSDIHIELLNLYHELDYSKLQTKYHQSLYRKDGFHPYIDTATKEHFLARIERVEPDGKLILITKKGEQREYYFKEVQTHPNPPEGRT